MAPKKEVKPYRGQTLNKKETQTEFLTDKLKTAYKNTAGAMSVPDALVWGALRPNSSMKKEIEKILEDFPDSALQTSDAHDFLADMEMEPGTARNVLGTVLNVVGPEGVIGAGMKLAGKTPKYLSMSGAMAQELGNWAKKKGAREFVEKNIKQKDFDKGMVEPFTELIDKEKLYKDLSDPEKLRNKLSGESKLNEELKKVGILKSEKEQGMVGEAGEKIGDFMDEQARKNPHVKINRNGIVSRLLKKQSVRNSTPGLEPLDIEKYSKKLEGVFNPQKESLVRMPRKVSPNAKADVIPEIPSDDIMEKLAKIEEKIQTSKKTGEANAALKKERDLLKKKVDEENLNISKENELIDGLGLEIQDVPVIPKKTKSTQNLPSFPPKEVTELMIEKEKALRNNKKLFEAIKKNPEMTPKIPSKELDLSDVPPEIPADSLEDLLKQKQDLLSTKGNLDKSNKTIKTENTEAARLLNKLKSEPTKYIRFIQDNYSDLSDLQKVKQHLNKEMQRLYKNKNVPDFNENELRMLDQVNEVDDAIIAELNKIDPDAALEYRRLNNDYGTKKGFDNLMKPVEASARKAEKDSRAMERVAGGATGALAAWLAGARDPMSMVAMTSAGAVGSGVVRKTVGALPENMAKWGDIMSDPMVGHLVGQSTEELIKAPGRNDKEIPVATDDMFDLSGVKEEGVAPVKGREPKSVVEAPADAQSATDIMAPQDIHQKMDEELAPSVRPTWNPYINEEILNTPLPRDTERLLKNPNALIAKLQQVAPNQVSTFKDMMTQDPDGLKKAAPKIAMMFPTVFENDDYGMFDGKIEDPKMQEKFLFDLADDESMDSIEKAQMAMKVHRKERIY